MRLALACAVAQGADVFLLDEPTNHLDSVAAWLQQHARVGHEEKLLLSAT